MWHAKCTGPRTDIESVCVPTWREALGAVCGHIKHAASTLLVETQRAKPDAEWSATDGVHTFSLTFAPGHTDLMIAPEDIDALLLDEPLPDAHGAALTAASVEFENDPLALLDVDRALFEAPDLETAATALGLLEPAREHSELGASIATRWRKCPASVRLVRGQPNPSSPAAQRGTAAHEVAHMCLVNGQDAIEYVGRIVNDIEIDEPIADGVQAYLDDCRACPATETQYEVRFNLESLNPPSPMYGTADFVGYDVLEQRLYVKDYKNGFMYVDAVGNDQLRYYALGALLWLDRPVSDIHVTICQPNALGATLKTDTFDAVELVEWSVGLIADAHKTQDPNAPAVTGPWCDKTFCPVRASCSARAAHSLAAAQVEFSDYLSPMRTPEVRLLSAAERGAIYGAADGLRAFLNAIEESIKADTAGTGWKLVPTDPRQAWRDKDEAAAALQMDHGIDPYEPAEVISPAAARGKLKESLHAERVALHATGKKPTKKDAEADARKLLASLIVEQSGGTKLVPEADPRPAIPTGGAEFDKVTQ